MLSDKMKQLISCHHSGAFFDGFFVKTNQAIVQFPNIFNMDASFDKTIVNILEVCGFDAGHG